jgi:hypothetical protein
MKGLENFDRPLPQQWGQEWINHVVTPVEMVALNGEAVTMGMIKI